MRSTRHCGTCPNASGSTVQTPSASAGLTRVLAKSLDLIKDMGDDYVATEHLLLALAIVDSPVRTVLKEHGVDEKSLREAIKAVRGNRKVTSQEAEATYEALEKYAVDLTTGRRVRQARPGDRARRRDPPGGAGAVASYEEQPGAHR